MGAKKTGYIDVIVGTYKFKQLKVVFVEDDHVQNNGLLLGADSMDKLLVSPYMKILAQAAGGYY